jgi:hypothetical protein
MAACLSRQVTEAFPWDTAPRYLLRDRDASYGSYFCSRVEAMNITEVVTAPRSPWQNAYVERVIGSIRRECLDHFVIFNERHLGRILSSYVDYYQRTRTHIFRSTRIAPTPAGSCHAGSERWSPSRKSAACIIATNVSPLDSYRIPLTNGCVALVRGRLTISVSKLSGCRSGADRFDIQIAARLASSNQLDSNSRSAQIPVQIRFLVGTARTAPLRVGQNLVSFVDLMKTLGVGSRADIGMNAEDEPAIRAPDCRKADTLLDAQDRV